MEKKKIFSTRVMAEIALLAAFAVVLDLIQSAICKFFPLWPNGGSIGIAMVPIIMLAYRRGTICGLLGGLIVGILDMMDGVDLSPLAVNGWMVLASILLDYALAWAVVGLAGLVGKQVRTATTKRSICLWGVLGALIAGSARFVLHFLSGMYMWEAGTKVLNIAIDLPHYAYSLAYNTSYLLPSIFACMIVVSLLLAYQPKAMVNNIYLKATEHEKGEEL